MATCDTETGELKSMVACDNEWLLFRAFLADGIRLASKGLGKAVCCPRVGEGVLWCFVLLSHRLSRTSLGNQHPLKDTTGEMARRTGSASVGLLTSSGLLVYRATTSSLKNPCTSGVKTLCFTLFGERRIIMDSNSADCLCNLMWSARNSQVHGPNSNCRIRRVFLRAGDRFGLGARTKAQGRQGISPILQSGGELARQFLPWFSTIPVHQPLAFASLIPTALRTVRWMCADADALS